MKTKALYALMLLVLCSSCNQDAGPLIDFRPAVTLDVYKVKTSGIFEKLVFEDPASPANKKFTDAEIVLVRAGFGGESIPKETVDAAKNKLKQALYEQNTEKAERAEKALTELDSIRPPAGLETNFQSLKKALRVVKEGYNEFKPLLEELINKGKVVLNPSQSTDLKAKAVLQAKSLKEAMLALKEISVDVGRSGVSIRDQIILTYTDTEIEKQANAAIKQLTDGFSGSDSQGTSSGNAPTKSVSQNVTIGGSK